MMTVLPENTVGRDDEDNRRRVSRHPAQETYDSSNLEYDD